MSIFSSESKLILIKCAQKQMYNGKKADGTFTSSEWNLVTADFNNQSSAYKDKSQLQSQLSSLKKQYAIVSALRNNSGLGWDDEKNIPLGSDEVFNDCLLALAFFSIAIFVCLFKFSFGRLI
jgi:hypothetical protein